MPIFEIQQIGTKFPRYRIIRRGIARRRQYWTLKGWNCVKEKATLFADTDELLSFADHDKIDLLAKHAQAQVMGTITSKQVRDVLIGELETLVV